MRASCSFSLARHMARQLHSKLQCPLLEVCIPKQLPHPMREQQTTCNMHATYVSKQDPLSCI